MILLEIHNGCSTWGAAMEGLLGVRKTVSFCRIVY